MEKRISDFYLVCMPKVEKSFLTFIWKREIVIEGNANFSLKSKYIFQNDLNRHQNLLIMIHLYLKSFYLLEIKLCTLALYKKPKEKQQKKISKAGKYKTGKY